MANVPPGLQKSREWIKAETLTNAEISPTAAIASTKLAAWSADRNAGANKLTNLAAGTAGTDAVNVDQLNSAITTAQSGLSVKTPARVASTANVAGTYNSTGGASARGQFTGMPTALDGVSLNQGDRVLLKDQTAADSNGVWVVTTLGTGSNGMWDRAEDFDEDSEVVDGTFVFVGEGTANANTQWVLTTNNDVTIGGASGTNLVFSQFGAGTTYTADGTTLQLNANEFSVKAGGIGETELATGAVTGAKIANDAIDSQHYADGSIDSNHLANGAVTNDKLGADSVDGTKLADEAVDSEHLAAEAVSVPALAIHEEIITTGKDGATSAFTLSTAIYQAGATVTWAGAVLFPSVGATPGQFTITGTTGGGTTLTLLGSAAPESDEFLAVRGYKI